MGLSDKIYLIFAMSTVFGETLDACLRSCFGFRGLQVYTFSGAT